MSRNFGSTVVISQGLPVCISIWIAIWDCAGKQNKPWLIEYGGWPLISSNLILSWSIWLVHGVVWDHCPIGSIATTNFCARRVNRIPTQPGPPLPSFPMPPFLVLCHVQLHGIDSFKAKSFLDRFSKVLVLWVLERGSGKKRGSIFRLWWLVILGIKLLANSQNFHTKYLLECYHFQWGSCVSVFT